MEKATPPNWFNDCIEESAQIDSSVFQASKDKVETVIIKILALAIVMIIVIFLAFIMIAFACIVQLVFIFMSSSRRNIRINKDTWADELSSYIKHYSLFN